MFNADMREYNYYTFGDQDDYGVSKLSKEVQGKVKMAIYTTSQTVQDNVNYSGANYVGLTHDANINSKYVIDYDGEKLKVLYVNKRGRYKQVYLGAM